MSINTTRIFRWLKSSSSNKRDDWSSIFKENKLKPNSSATLQKMTNGIFHCRSCKKAIQVDLKLRLKIVTCYNCGSELLMPTKIANYWLFEEIVCSHSSCVYKAVEDEGPPEELVIKLLPEEQKGDKIKGSMLLEEAELGIYFGSYPHLVQIIDYGIDNDEYYIAMENINGIRLDKIVSSKTKCPQSQVILWVLQIIKALNHIYEKGYLYRAINTKNIMVDMDGNIKLVDYGISVPIEETLVSNQEFICGTPHYIPPERILGKAEDQYSEIYSVGMLFYLLLTRENYFSGQDTKEIINQHISPLRMENLSLKMPAGTYKEVIAIIAKMIKFNSAERYQTFLEVGTELMGVFNKYMQNAKN